MAKAVITVFSKDHRTNPGRRKTSDEGKIGKDQCSVHPIDDSNYNSRGASGVVDGISEERYSLCPFCSWGIVAPLECEAG